MADRGGLVQKVRPLLIRLIAQQFTKVQCRLCCDEHTERLLRFNLISHDPVTGIASHGWAGVTDELSQHELHSCHASEFRLINWVSLPNRHIFQRYTLLLTHRLPRRPTSGFLAVKRRVLLKMLRRKKSLRTARDRKLV